MAIQVEAMQKLKYFARLNMAELESIRPLLFERTAGRGDFILHEGEPSDVLFFVVAGAIKVLQTSAEGKEQILSVVRPGESFNEVPVLDGKPSPASIQAMGPVTLYGMHRNELQSALREHPQLDMNIIYALAERVRHLMSLVEDLSFRHVIDRIARLLLENAGSGGENQNRLTQQEMAAIAGTAREVVGRSLRALEDEGLIRMERHRIIITDEEALREKVRANP